jgi:histidyl-tRNA synthetase
MVMEGCLFFQKPFISFPFPVPFPFLSFPFQALEMYKIAKGAKDLTGDEFRRVQILIAAATELFKQNGGTPLDTPVFERTDVLLGKYGEEAETKLIYKLADQGGEDLSLRYDMTIPFVRYVKENGIRKMRRYTIGKVYRRDQPNPGQGRMREFYQADFDIMGGKQDGMLAEATLLNIAAQFMTRMKLNYRILINDVRNLQTILETKLGITNWRKITPIVDKLDKQSFESLTDEFKAADPTLDLVALKEALLNPAPYNPSTVSDFAALGELADVFGFADRLVFTNTLARGLDYYTGFIWEVKVDGIDSTVSAGGRYDNLLKTPTAGISLGISRIAAVVDWSLFAEQPNRDCFVTTVGDISITDKLRVVKNLQDSGDYTAVLYDFTPDSRKLGVVLSDAAKAGAGFVAIITEDEWNAGRTIQIKNLQTKESRRVIV